MKKSEMSRHQLIVARQQAKLDSERARYYGIPVEKAKAAREYGEVTVFEAKGRRVTTRAKEERGGGRRNASRPKSKCIPSCPRFDTWTEEHKPDCPAATSKPPSVWGSEREVDAKGRNCHDPRCVRGATDEKHCIGDVGCTGRFTSLGYVACWSTRCKLMEVHPIGYQGCCTPNTARYNFPVLPHQSSPLCCFDFPDCTCRRPKLRTQAEREEAMRLQALPKQHEFPVEQALRELKAAVHELISAECSQTRSYTRLQVKGAARKKMIAKEKLRLQAAWAAVDRLSK